MFNKKLYHIKLEFKAKLMQWIEQSAQVRDNLKKKYITYFNHEKNEPQNRKEILF